MERGAAIRDTSPSAERLCLELAVPSADTRAVFGWWTVPERICQWWPTEATITAEPGGEYHLAWPAQGWHLRGRYLAVEPGERLAFTWTWDHDPEVTKTVDVLFALLAERGTLLTLTHGPYAATEKDAELRASHLDGWRHFLPRLRARAMGEAIG